MTMAELEAGMKVHTSFGKAVVVGVEHTGRFQCGQELLKVTLRGGGREWVLDTQGDVQVRTAR